MPKADLQGVIVEILEPLRAAGSTISLARLCEDPRLGTVSDATKRGHLKRFITSNLEYLGTVQGLLPTADAVIDLAEREMGEAVSEKNVSQANRNCAAIVGRVAEPVVREFVSTGLEKFLHGEELRVPLRDLMDFLLGEFASFTKGAGNGLVSIAGTINEKLLVRCLLEKGLGPDEFQQTGKNSESDILIHARGGVRANLGVEVKSYHARERLLRGLRDIERPKVGAGYFIDAGEFNAARTQLLLQTSAAAIYMPGETLARVDPVARDMTTNDRAAFGSRFYRPLERFASDMKHFVETGELPAA